MTTFPLLQVTVLLCDGCARHVTPPRFSCPHCGSEALRDVHTPGLGQLVSTTTIRRAPMRFRQDAPYMIAVVDLDCGTRITARWGEDAQPDLGINVRATRIDNGIVYFEPA